MTELDRLWKINQELTDKLKGRKSAKLVKLNPKLNPSTLNARLHELGAELNGLTKTIEEMKSELDVARWIIENGVYVVDFGNIGGKRSRETFPSDLLAALQYFGYVSDKYDWAEILLSVNISYSDKYVAEKRKQERLKQMEKENEKANNINYEED